MWASLDLEVLYDCGISVQTIFMIASHREFDEHAIQLLQVTEPSLGVCAVELNNKVAEKKYQ